MEELKKAEGSGPISRFFAKLTTPVKGKNRWRRLDILRLAVSLEKDIRFLEDRILKGEVETAFQSMMKISNAFKALSKELYRIANDGGANLPAFPEGSPKDWKRKTDREEKEEERKTKQLADLAERKRKDEKNRLAQEKRDKARDDAKKERDRKERKKKKKRELMSRRELAREGYTVEELEHMMAEDDEEELISSESLSIPPPSPSAPALPVAPSEGLDHAYGHEANYVTQFDNYSDDRGDEYISLIDEIDDHLEQGAGIPQVDEVLKELNINPPRDLNKAVENLRGFLAKLQAATLGKKAGLGRHIRRKLLWTYGEMAHYYRTIISELDEALKIVNKIENQAEKKFDLATLASLIPEMGSALNSLADSILATAKYYNSSIGVQGEKKPIKEFRTFEDNYLDIRNTINYYQKYF